MSCHESAIPGILSESMPPDPESVDLIDRYLGLRFVTMYSVLLASDPSPVPRDNRGQHTQLISRVDALRGGGSFAVESVAGLAWNTQPSVDRLFSSILEDILDTS